MTAEAIVRALAAANTCTYEEEDWHSCVLCLASLPVRAADHEPECPWRLAVEWVEATDTP